MTNTMRTIRVAGILMIISIFAVSTVQDAWGQSKRASKPQWEVYKSIANQATDHTAFDAVLNQAEQASTDEDIQGYDSKLWTALKQLITTGTTKTGQFDLTALIGTTEVKEFSNTKTGNVTYTLKDMPAGQYTLKVQAFQRPADYLTTNSLYELGRDTYRTNLFFGSETQRVKNINDDARYSPLSSYQQGAKWLSIPSNLSGAKAAFNEGLYWNVMRATLDADADVKMGVKIVTASSDNWMVCGNFRLYYGQPTVDIQLSQSRKYDITEDTYANVTSNITVTPGKPAPICLPFDLNEEQTASLFKAVYVFGGIEESSNGSLNAQLVPVKEMKAGHSYYVEVEKETTVEANDVLLRALTPDTNPALWEGGELKGNYATKGYSGTLTLDAAYKSKASTLQFTTLDYNDMTFWTDLTNRAARKYLSEVTYTEASPSVIYNYYLTPPLRRDQPKSVLIPVPKSENTLTLTLSRTEDFAETKTQSIPAGTSVCEVLNLVPNQDYYYKVEENGEVISKGHIQTKGAVRMIKASSISNLRDLGGWINCDNNRIRYEKIYRGSEMDKGQVLNSYDTKKIQALNISAEIDLRSQWNVGGTPTTSPLGSKVKFFFANLGRWSDNTLQLDVTTWSNTFKFLVNNVNAGRPLYFHCQVGADRTGCLAQLIEGVLGFSRNQMYHDYELTSYSQAGERRKVKVDPAINYVIQSSKGHTLQQHYFHYITTKLGVPATDLANFINNMVEGESSILHYPLQFDFDQGSCFERLSDIYALCTVGSTLASGAKATLQADGGESKSVTMKVEGLVITFADTQLTPSTQYTLTIPAGSVIDADGQTINEAKSLKFRTPDQFASHFYLYSPALGKFLGRGANFGSRLITDNIGLPVSIETHTDGNKRIKFLDNGLFLSHDGYGDRASTAENLNWTIEQADNGFVLKASNGKYMTASNGYFTASAQTAKAATLFVMKTASEQKTMVKETQYAGYLEAAKRAGLEATTITDMNALIAKCSTTNLTNQIKNATSGSTSSWTLTEPADSKTASAQAYNAGNYGGELFNKHGYVSQTISVDKPGLYKLTATILSRQGSNANCYAWGKEGYALTNAYLAVNDKYWAQIPDWYSAAASSTNPDNTGQAKTLMDGGKYKVELYAYVDNSKKLNVRIYQPAYTVFVWCVFNNFTLTRIETGETGEDPGEEEEKTYPDAGDKGYLYNIQAKKFINADAVMDDEGVRFTIVSEDIYEGGWNKNNNIFTDPAGRTFPTVRFTTDFTDAERENKQTMLSCRADNEITATKVYGYGVFPLYYVEGKGLLIFCFYNKDNTDFYTPGKCLSYDSNGKLVFVDEEQATYWKFVSQSEYNKMTGQTDDEDENKYTGEGYSNLEPSMFRHWDDAVNPTVDEAVACDYHINDPAITVYGDGNLNYLNFADLSEYDKLIVVVTSDNPRIYFNKVDGGKYNASDEAASGRIEITTAGGWAEKYYTMENGVWTIDLKKIVADKGYARLNGIKGPTYDTTVTVSHMVLYKDPAGTSITDVTKTQSPSTIYNLSGQRMNGLHRGLNIVGNKKIMVR